MINGQKTRTQSKSEQIEGLLHELEQVERENAKLHAAARKSEGGDESDERDGVIVEKSDGTPQRSTTENDARICELIDELKELQNENARLRTKAEIGEKKTRLEKKHERIKDLLQRIDEQDKTLEVLKTMSGGQVPDARPLAGLSGKEKRVMELALELEQLEAQNRELKGLPAVDPAASSSSATPEQEARIVELLAEVENLEQLNRQLSGGQVPDARPLAGLSGKEKRVMELALELEQLEAQNRELKGLFDADVAAISSSSTPEQEARIVELLAEVENLEQQKNELFGLSPAVPVACSASTSTSSSPAAAPAAASPPASASGAASDAACPVATAAPAPTSASVSALAKKTPSFFRRKANDASPSTTDASSTDTSSPEPPEEEKKKRGWKMFGKKARANRPDHRR